MPVLPTFFLLHTTATAGIGPGWPDAYHSGSCPGFEHFTFHFTSYPLYDLLHRYERTHRRTGPLPVANTLRLFAYTTTHAARMPPPATCTRFTVACCLPATTALPGPVMLPATCTCHVHHTVLPADSAVLFVCRRLTVPAWTVCGTTLPWRAFCCRASCTTHLIPVVFFRFVLPRLPDTLAVHHLTFLRGSPLDYRGLKRLPRPLTPQVWILVDWFRYRTTP